jgi:hypothetical protein
MAPAGMACSDGIECNGVEICDGAGTCWRGAPPTSGPCVPGAPQARFYIPQEVDLISRGSGSVLLSYTGTAPPYYSGGTVGISYSAQPTGELVYGLRGQQDPNDPQLISSIEFETESTYGVRTFQVWTSLEGNDPDDYSLAYEGVADPEAGLVRFELPVPVPARFVRFVMVDNHGGYFTRVRFLRIFTPKRTGSILSLPEAGTTASASSNTTWLQTVHDFTDPLSVFSPSVWTSAAGDVAGARVTLDLPGETPWSVDRVSFQPRDAVRGVRDYQVWISDRTGADSDFRLVATGTLQRTSAERWWAFFPPTLGRHVRLVVVSNHGDAQYVEVPDFQVHAANRGGLTTTFQDSSVPGDDPIEAWTWDFGDGTRARRFSIPGTRFRPRGPISSASR